MATRINGKLSTICLGITYTIFAVCLIHSPDVCSQAPPNDPADTESVLLMSLDGETTNVEGDGPAGELQCGYRYAAGRTGQALSLGGRDWVNFPAVAEFQPGDSSWTLEAWIKPQPQQSDHAYIISSGWGSGRQFGLRISYGNKLVGQFNAGNDAAAWIESADVGATLYDGEWHHVAAVLDREQGGALRLYLDGQRVGAGPGARQEPSEKYEKLRM